MALKVTHETLSVTFVLICVKQTSQHFTDHSPSWTNSILWQRVPFRPVHFEFIWKSTNKYEYYELVKGWFTSGNVSPTAHSLGKVVVDVFFDGFISCDLVNLGNGNGLGLVVKPSGFLGNNVMLNACTLRET